MEQCEMSSIDAYLNRAFRIIVVLPLTGATTSAFVFTIFRLLGWWPDIPSRLLAVYDVVNVFYLAVAVYLFRTCKDEFGIIRLEKIKQGKLFVGFVVVAQWNFISYLIPDREWWAYLFFFIALTIVFFDIRFTSILSFLLTASTVISWIVHGKYMFLSSADPFFYPTLVLRLFCMALTILTLLFITYFGGKYLVEELERHANYDPLTNLLNRRSMGSYLKSACEKVEAGKASFCLMMMDIDDFKHVNDTHGHDCGDAVLRRVAYTVATGVKKDDYVFRYGGEEILVLLQTDFETAQLVAERIRKDIAKDPVRYREGVSVPVTVTIGLTAFERGKEAHAVLEEADAKLYYGKRHGKNCVVVETEE